MLNIAALASPSTSTVGAPRLTCAAVLALAALIAAPDALAQGKERSGKEVVDANCAKCHATGAQGAPKIGNQRAWSKRAQQGLSSLTQNALKGIREMPPHGGNLELTDVEIERAITYMVNQSGGKWVEPISRTAPTAARTGEQIVKMHCFKCHQDGVGGAPRIGDRDAWIPRLKAGLDNTVQSAIKGHGGMPARGGLANLTDGELRNAIIYMFQAPAAAKPASPPK